MKKARSIRYFPIGVQNEGTDAVGVLQNVVGVSHDGHTVYKVFKLLGLCHSLRAGRRHRPLGLPEEVCFPRQIGVELSFSCSV